MDPVKAPAFGVYRKQRDTHLLHIVPSHLTGSAAPSFYLQTLTRPHSPAPKTLFWSNVIRINCTLFQQQTLLITCNVPGQQTTGTDSYCWVKTEQPCSPASFKWGAFLWEMLLEIKRFQRNKPVSGTFLLSIQPINSPPCCWMWSPGCGTSPGPHQPRASRFVAFWQGDLSSCPRAAGP